VATTLSASFVHIFTVHAQKRLFRSFRSTPFAPATSISYKTDELPLPSDVYEYIFEYIFDVFVLLCRMTM